MSDRTNQRGTSLIETMIVFMHEPSTGKPSRGGHPVGESQNQPFQLSFVGRIPDPDQLRNVTLRGVKMPQLTGHGNQGLIGHMRGRAPNRLIIRRHCPVPARSRTGFRDWNDWAFTLLEAIVVVAIILVLAAIAIPLMQAALLNYRTVGDARSIASQLGLARMRAASNFTRARLNFNLTANTYQLEVWDKASNAYQVERGVQALSQGVTFGFGNITTPAGSQSTIAQTTPITFNSRGISVDSSGNPTANGAIYITNGHGLCLAVTASVTGQTKAWQWNGTTWNPL
jgi:Tfp pilus assembly protein FimT